jgi:hypothetical protein
MWQQSLFFHDQISYALILWLYRTILPKSSPPGFSFQSCILWCDPKPLSTVIIFKFLDNPCYIHPQNMVQGQYYSFHFLSARNWGLTEKNPQPYRLMQCRLMTLNLGQALRAASQLLYMASIFLNDSLTFSSFSLGLFIHSPLANNLFFYFIEKKKKISFFWPL